MRLLYFRDKNHQNFGDELNRLIFPPLFGKLFLNPDGGLFYGIGTLLNVENPTPALVFGSGAGYYQAMNLNGVDVRFVRGPRSVEYLGLDDKKAITDPAILVADMVAPSFKTVVFVPRWTTIGKQPDLAKHLVKLGIEVVDPREDVEIVLNKIAKAEYVISEALHGAVVADSLRIPWTPVYAEDGHTFKWLDWTASLNMAWNPVDLRVQSVAWTVSHGPRLLSDDTIFRERLDAVKEQVRNVRRDYNC